MLKLVTLPKRPYKNFVSFLFEHRQYTKKGVEYPCFHCNGWGQIWDPAGYDLHEGNKLNRKIPCSECKGTGEITKEKYQLHYKTMIDKWRKVYIQLKEKLSLQQSGLKKLTDDEKAALFENY